MKKAKPRSLMGSKRQRDARKRKQIKLGKFTVDVKPQMEPSSGRQATRAYNERIAYKEAWRADRKRKVDEFVQELIAKVVPLSTVAAVVKRVESIKFETCDALPSKTHVKLAEAARQRYLKRVEKIARQLMIGGI